jgi:hypothetical protein
MGSLWFNTGKYIEKDINWRNPNDGHFTGLMYYTYNGIRDQVKYFIENGANLDLQDDEGSTALMMATYNGFYDIVEMLLDAGADYSIRDFNGDAPYDYIGTGTLRNIFRKRIVSDIQRLIGTQDLCDIVFKYVM